jgi:hypothetical protein
MSPDLEPGIRLVAEVSHLLAELREALPLLSPKGQVAVRLLMGEMESTLTMVGYALGIVAGAAGAAPGDSLNAR